MISLNEQFQLNYMLFRFAYLPFKACDGVFRRGNFLPLSGNGLSHFFYFSFLFVNFDSGVYFFY
jgi:hypothetical protein